MTGTKTSTLTLRMDPFLKEALRVAAGQEHRSITNMVEVMIRDYCTQNGISIPDQNNCSLIKSTIDTGKSQA